jgi:hypothetical protein
MNKSIVLGLVAILSVCGARAVTGAVVTRGPYLQIPTASSIIVRWRTDVATTSEVAYGTTQGSLTLFAGTSAATTEHVVSVTGLTADTQYYYSIGEIGLPLAGNTPAHYFRTAPTTGTAKPMRFWSIGDAGFTGANLDAVRDAYGVFAGTSAADLFLLLGDNAYLTGTDSQYQAAVFDEHAFMLQTTPVWSVVGNHEAFSSNSATQTGPYFDMFTFPTAAEAGGIASGTESYFSFDYGNIHFIVLDSEQAPTSATTPQMLWLDADLQNAVLNDPDWIVALWHRPPYSKGLFHNSDAEVNEVRMREYAVPILEDYGVDVIFNGHSHNYERSYLIDSHYGLSGTFSSANQIDPGDGDPAGDGAYRKENLGPDPHQGAVYVVNGSGSEVRNTTLDHPAMVTGLLELGSVVIDVDTNTFTTQFLNSSGQVKDTFQIVKGTVCPAIPASGCASAPKGKLKIKKHPTDASKDQWKWNWKKGTVDSGDFGDPADQTDLAVCVYDANGVVVGGSILHGAPEWAPIGGGLQYKDKSLSRHGVQKIKVKFTSGLILVKAKGTGIGMTPLAVTFPVKAQLVNLDSGACWESAFPTAKKNEADKVIAVQP